MVDREFASMMRQACRADFFFWMACFCWTIDQKRPYTRKKLPFITYQYQDKGFDVLLRSLDEGFDVQVEKSRQMGASWMFVALVVWCWLYRGGQNFLLLSRSDEYVDKSNEPKSLFWKIDFILENLPIWMLPAGWNKNKHRLVKRLINPQNGNTIVGEATTEDSGRGGTFTAVLHDEFAACDVGMGILKSTRSATSTRWFNSTPKGTGNAHYRIVQLSRQNPAQVRPLTFHWSDHPEYGRLRYKLDEQLVPVPMGKTKQSELNEYLDHNQDLIESLKRRGFWDEWKVRSPWFDVQCSRATTKAEISQEVEIDYGGAGYQFFESKDIQNLIQLYCCPPKTKGDLVYDLETLDPLTYREHGHGNLELWCELLGKREAFQPPARPYVVGVDCAAGTGASNSVLSIWDAKSCEKVGQYVDPHIKPERLAKLTIALCKWFWDAYLIWETNGSGRAFGDAVIEWGYGRFYKRASKSETGETGANAGWAPTRDNKYQLLSQYRGALVDRTVCNRCESAMRETLEYLFLGNNWVEHSALNENDDPSGARDQHGDRCFIEGTMIATDRGERPIEQIAVGDLVWTRKGLRKVQACGETGKARVYDVELSNGRILTGTANHPVWTENRGWVHLSLLSTCDRLVEYQSHHKERMAWENTEGERTNVFRRRKRLFSMGGSTTETPVRFRNTGSGTSGDGENWETKRKLPCMLRCGSIITAMYRKAWSFTTKMATRATTTFPISHVLAYPCTAHYITPEGIWTGLDTQRCIDTRVSSAVRHTSRFAKRGQGFVVWNANTRIVTTGVHQRPESISTSVKNAERCTRHSVRQGRSSVVGNASSRTETIGLRQRPEKHAVYNLSVADVPEYFANGILVHNCMADALAVKVLNDQPKQVTEVKHDHSPLSVAGRRDMRKSLEKEKTDPYRFN
jgi:hypothetical protein